MVQPDTFGAWVRHRRRELDLTQEELARLVGCARITIRKIEAEQLRPSRQMAALLGEQLRIAPNEREHFLNFARSGVAAARAAAQGPRHNLPLELTSFVGREREVTEVCNLLQTSRLLTLTGSGGTGKSRLSLRVAAEVLITFRDGAWLIELASLSDRALLPSTIASALGVRQESSRPLLDTLLDWLGSRQLLLILDNCEHLIEACARFANAALQACPEMRILASSRQSFGIAGETCYRVPSLAFPSVAQAGRLRPQQLQEYPASRLFIERATGAHAAFRVSDSDVASIVEICEQLDGIPLAIELAAARVTALRLEQIAARLNDRFGLLTRGTRTALPRHQTLHSLIDWSHNLLSQPERTLLRRLSVFAGGWTLEAAEDVCAGNGLESSEILNQLAQLVDKSLIALDERAARPRYRMLETIRQYAREKLIEADEIDSFSDRHLHYFLSMVERSRPMLDTVGRPSWLLLLEAEQDNLQAALARAHKEDAETAQWLAGLLERYWFFGDRLSEARTWYLRILDSRQHGPATRGLALALLGSGCVAFNLGLMDEAERSMESSMAIWRQLEEREWLAWALGWLAYLLVQSGRSAPANAIYTENEALFRASSDPTVMIWVLSSWGTAKSALRQDDPSAKLMLDGALALAEDAQDPFGFVMAYSCLGDWALLRGDHAAAGDYFMQALNWRRRLGTGWITAAGLWQVASILRLRGDHLQAEPMYAEALKLARELGDQRSEAHLSQELGVVAIHLGDVRGAAALLEASLASFRKWEDPLGIARCLLGFADLWTSQGHAQTAARLIGFLDLWLQSSNIQLLHFDRTNYERSLAAARMQLNESDYTDARRAGEFLTLEQAVGMTLVPAQS